MPIITISRGSYSKGKEIAEKVADRLGFACISRGDLHKKVTEKFNIPEVALVRAIHDAPTILGRLGYKKEKYVACVQATILQEFQKDNIVYHGLAGHFLVKGIAHVMKVRIMADMKDRVTWEMARENISEKEARNILEKDDQERRKWSKYLYGIDTWDPQSYDMVLHIKKLSADDAVDIISHTASFPSFQATDESKQKMNDMLIASSVRLALVDYKPDVEIYCRNGDIIVRTTVSLIEEATVADKINSIVLAIPGVKSVKVSAHAAFMDV